MTSPSGHSAVEQTAGRDAVKAAPGDEPARLATASGPDTTVGAQKPYDVGPVWALLLPPLATLALSLWGITTPSFWRDEAATIAAVRRPFGDLIGMLGNVDAVHAAYYIMMWPIEHLFGPSELVMRLPSALAAAVTAAFVAAIGRRVVSPWVGLAAGLLFAVLPVASRYGQEARSYAMVVGMATVASYLLIRVLGAQLPVRRRWMIGYGASLAALGILNIFGLLLIPAHAVTVALHYRRHRGEQDGKTLALGWLAAAVVAVVIAGPLLVLGWEQRGQVAWIAHNQSSSGLYTLVTLSGSALVTVVVAGVIALGAIVSSAAGGSGGSSPLASTAGGSGGSSPLASTAAGATEARRAAWRWQLTELSLPWMLVPPVLLIGASVISPIYTSRYVLMCIPPAALIGGMAIVALGRVAGPVALALILLAGLTTQVTQRQPYGHYDNVRALDQIVAAHAKPGDVVLYTNPNAESFGAAYSYGLGKLPNVAQKQAAIPSGTLAGTSVSLATLRKRLAHASRVWVVEINHCLSEPQMLTLSGNKEGPALSRLPLSFVRIWHERGDWLLLYKHGAGNQATTTACHGHT
jgi:mannosyltransferase